jgi:hypothetical protein
MIVYFLIIFGLATTRTITPLVKVKNYNFVNLVFAITHIVAYIYLLKHFVNIN